jgi:hypothetical protein
MFKGRHFRVDSPADLTRLSHWDVFQGSAVTPDPSDELDLPTSIRPKTLP